MAISCGLSVKPTENSLYGLGSTTVPPVGMAYAEIAVDDVCPRQVLLLVVPNTVQQLDVIIGRKWLDMLSIEYRKVDGQLHLYRAEPCSGQTERTVTTVSCDADYIHTVEVREIPVGLPLVESDFGYVKPDVTAVEREGLLELVNEYRDCFAKDLGELGCTPLMTVDINEVPDSVSTVQDHPVRSRRNRQDSGRLEVAWCGSRYHLSIRQRGDFSEASRREKSTLCRFPYTKQTNCEVALPLPDMLKQLEYLAEGRMFMQLDLASGFLQIPLSADTSEKTAFITTDTAGEFTRMPFGLSGAVAEFTRLMQRVLGPLKGKVVRNYLFLF